MKPNKRVQRGHEEGARGGRRVLEVTRKEERGWRENWATDGAGNPCLFLLSDDSSPRAITPTQTFRHNELMLVRGTSSPAEEHHLPTQKGDKRTAKERDRLCFKP